MESRVFKNDAALIPWNSMELGGIIYGDSRVPWNSMEYSMEVQGNLMLTKMKPCGIWFGGTRVSSMEFHGKFQGIFVSFGMAPA